MKTLLRTNDWWTSLVVRVALGIVMVPHGAQKLLGWFGGGGLWATVTLFSEKLHISGGFDHPGHRFRIAGRPGTHCGFSHESLCVRGSLRHGGGRCAGPLASWVLHELVRKPGRGGVRVSHSRHGNGLGPPGVWRGKMVGGFSPVPAGKAAHPHPLKVSPEPVSIFHFLLCPESSQRCGKAVPLLDPCGTYPLTHVSWPVSNPLHVCELTNQDQPSPDESRQHQDNPQGMDGVGDDMVVRQQTQSSQKIVPVVETGSLPARHTPKQDQNLGTGIIDIGCRVHQAFGGPPEGCRGSEGIPCPDEKSSKTNEGHEDLAEKSSQHPREIPEKRRKMTWPAS